MLSHYTLQGQELEREEYRGAYERGISTASSEKHCSVSVKCSGRKMRPPHVGVKHLIKSSQHSICGSLDPRDSREERRKQTQKGRQDRQSETVDFSDRRHKRHFNLVGRPF
ncbi:uncharacterized protein Hap1MRO34_009924 isoform 1-T2 [Clarias gariepinus]